MPFPTCAVALLCGALLAPIAVAQDAPPRDVAPPPDGAVLPEGYDLADLAKPPPPVNTTGIEFILSAQDFLRFCDQCAMSAEQRDQALMIYDQYAEALEQLSRRVRRRLERKGLDEIQGGQRVGLDDPKPELAQHRDLHYRLVKASRTEAYVFIRWALNRVESILEPGQVATWRRVIHAWKRRALLMSGRPSRFDLYALPDLIAQVETLGEECELLSRYRYFIRTEAPEAGESTIASWEGLDDILGRYAEAVEALLPELAFDMKDRRHDLMTAFIRGDERSARKEHRAYMQLWKRVLDLNLAYAAEVESHVRRHIGDRAAHRWRQAIDLAHYPMTAHPVSTQLMLAWMPEHLSLDDDQRAALEAIRTPYMDRERDLRARSMASAYESRVESPMFLDGWPPANLADRQADLEQVRRELARSTNRRLRAILTPEQQLRFDQELDRLLSDDFDARFYRY